MNHFSENSPIDPETLKLGAAFMDVVAARIALGLTPAQAAETAVERMKTLMEECEANQVPGVVRLCHEVSEAMIVQLGSDHPEIQILRERVDAILSPYRDAPKNDA